MDEYTEQLVKRTRERCATLSKKMETVDTPPPVYSDPHHESPADESNPKKREKDNDNGDRKQSPKRPCIRSPGHLVNDGSVKVDTPRIPSVRSRMTRLAQQRSMWEDGSENTENEQPVVKQADDDSPVSPTKSSMFASPTIAPSSASSRKMRLANLASTINNWDDDIRHHDVGMVTTPDPNPTAPKIIVGKIHTPTPIQSVSSPVSDRTGEVSTKNKPIVIGGGMPIGNVVAMFDSPNQSSPSVIETKSADISDDNKMTTSVSKTRPTPKNRTGSFSDAKKTDGDAAAKPKPVPAERKGTPQRLSEEYRPASVAERAMTFSELIADQKRFITNQPGPERHAPLQPSSPATNDDFISKQRRAAELNAATSLKTRTGTVPDEEENDSIATEETAAMEDGDIEGRTEARRDLSSVSSEDKEDEEEEEEEGDLNVSDFINDAMQTDNNSPSLVSNTSTPPPGHDDSMIKRLETVTTHSTGSPEVESEAGTSTDVCRPPVDNVDCDDTDMGSIIGNTPVPSGSTNTSSSVVTTDRGMIHQSVEVYRKHLTSIVRGGSTSECSTEESSGGDDTNIHCEMSTRDKIQLLTDKVLAQQSIIKQASHALNLCQSSETTRGSQEEAEAERLLFIATQRRMAFLREIQQLKNLGPRADRQSPTFVEPEQDGVTVPCLGTLTIGDVRLPLKTEYLFSMVTKHSHQTQYFFCVFRHGAQVIPTHLTALGRDPQNVDSDILSFTNQIKLRDLDANFMVGLEVYGLTLKAHKHDDKMSSSKGSKLNLLTKPSPLKSITPKRLLSHLKHKDTSSLPSPAGPMSVRTSNFTLIATTKIDVTAFKKEFLVLEKVPFLSPLYGNIKMNMQVHRDGNVSQKGFLTMFQDVGGFGAWHRRWCVLDNNRLAYWTYPDAELKKSAIGDFDLRYCTTGTVCLVARDICARPNTFELVLVRPQQDGDSDSIISTSRNTLTTTKYWLSADTKEERMKWIQMFNQSLVNLRTWDKDAFSPIPSQ